MKRKIFLLLPSLSGGGAEKIMLLLLKNLNKELFDVKLVLQREEGEFLDKIESKKDLIVLNSQGKVEMFSKLKTLLKKENPDVLLSSISRLNLLLAIIIPFMPKGIKYIAREANIISLLDKSIKDSILRKLFYNNFDKVIAQSNDMRKDILQSTNVVQEKVLIINNPVEKIEFINKKLNNNVKKLIAVGRLEHQKGFDLLLRAISLVKIENISLDIIGNGSKEKELKKLVKELNLNNKIKFLGFKKDVIEYIKQSDVFILSSRFEGFPNVVLEAHACGKPVVAFNCKGGLNELIEVGKNGELAELEDIKDLASKIEKSLNTKYDVQSIIDNNRDRYSKERIIKEYEKVLI